MANFSPRKWLVIDTDAGVDDAIAICLALQLLKSPQHSFELKAITTSFGNCDCPQVVKNVAKVRAANCMDVSTGPNILKGCEDPIKQVRFDATYFHGRDGLGDNSYPDENNCHPSNSLHAADFLLQVCAEVAVNNQAAENQPIELTLVTLGPMTNLATALMKDKDAIVSNLSVLVVMGGCGNGRGNQGRTTEFNVAADPEAAEVVFKALEGSTVTTAVLSWELVFHCTIPWEVFDDFVYSGPGRGNESVAKARLRQFLFDVTRAAYGPQMRGEGEMLGGAVVCDMLAVMVALTVDRRDLAPGAGTHALVAAHRHVHVEVELDGRHTRGQTVVDWGCYDGIKREPNCHWITDLNSAECISMFKDMFAHV